MVSRTSQPTLREVLVHQHPFVCPNCGDIVQLDQQVTLDGLEDVTIDTSCCDYEQTFDVDSELDDPLPESMADYDTLTSIAGVGSPKANRLIEEGIQSVSDVQEASQSDLAEIGGVGAPLAARIKADVGDGGERVRTEEASVGECPVDSCPKSPDAGDLYDHMIETHGWYSEALAEEYDG